MLEESKMDKKSINRLSQPQSRASAIDCKKNSELSYKTGPKNNKKREGPSGGFKNEPNRRNGPSQRGRGQVDRRPRTREVPDMPVGRTENTRVDNDDEPEIGSVFVSGSKKQNLNHLLNFMYPSRRGTVEDRRQMPRRYVPQRPYHRHEHDLYLRAYCQFVVKEDGEYKTNLLDPDVPIKWDQVEEIVVRSTGRSECPICLGTPVAGRVSLCGHVYCWACVLHYAATHDKQPPPCPVCTTGLLVNEMKPTRMVQWQSPSNEVTMRLVRRLRGSTVVEMAPDRGVQVHSITDSILPLKYIDQAPFAKIFTASKEQVHEILERERREIQDQILAEIDTTEIIYLEQALQLLTLKDKDLCQQSKNDQVLEKDTQDIAPIVYEKQTINENKVDWFDVNEEGAACAQIIEEQLENLNIDKSEINLNPEAPEFVITDLKDADSEEFPLIDCLLQAESTCESETNASITEIDKINQSKYFYFYQAEDGQQIFLNSLNVRILNASWGILAAAPPVIKGRVLHRETLPLTPETRKHMPYTAHLPLHCSFDVVELDLKPPHVTTEALKSFAEELERRGRARAREEKKRERWERRTRDGPPRPDLSSELMFPPAPSPPSTTSTPLPISEISSPDPLAASPSGLSFAKMAGTSGTWRVRVTPRAASPPRGEGVGDDREGGEEGEGAPRALLLSDAIEAALMAKTTTPTPKKNKKSKQKLLFATGMQRSS